MRVRTLIFSILGCLLLWTSMSIADSNHHEHALKVGKKGEITLIKQTRVGGRVLQPGTYVVQHRDSGDEHFVRFLEVKEFERHGARPRTYTEQENVGEIRCSVEPSPVPIKATTIYTVTEKEMPRITRVAIKGENYVHLIGKAEVAK